MTILEEIRDTLKDYLKEVEALRKEDEQSATFKRGYEYGLKVALAAMDNRMEREDAVDYTPTEKYGKCINCGNARDTGA